MFANVDLGAPQTSAKQLQFVAGLVYHPYESMLSLWTLCFTERGKPMCPLSSLFTLCFAERERSLCEFCVLLSERYLFTTKAQSEGTKSTKLVLRSIESFPLCALCVLPKERSLCALCPLYELCVLPSKRCFLPQRHKEHKVRASFF